MTDLFQFFETIDKSILQQQINEFCAGLDPDYFELVEIRLQEPNWDRAMIHYRSLVPPDQLQEIALQRLERERLKKEEEQKKQYSDEDLKVIAEENAKKEVPADSFHEGMKALEQEIKEKDPEFHKEMMKKDDEKVNG